MERMFVAVMGSRVPLPGRGCHKLEMEWAEVQPLRSADEAEVSFAADACWSASSRPHGDLQQDLAHAMKGLEGWPSSPGPWGGVGGWRTDHSLSGTLSLQWEKLECQSGRDFDSVRVLLPFYRGGVWGSE